MLRWTGVCALVLGLLVVTPVSAAGLNEPQLAAIPAGADIIVLAGQSNMMGFGTGPDSPEDAAPDPRIRQWDPYSGAIVAARDPLIMNLSPNWVGPGLTFAKAYLKTLPANRTVLLVGAAAGGTSFSDGFWLAPSGGGVVATVQRVNAAMAAAGPGARLAAILWHQGESDYGMAGPMYAGNLYWLTTYLRANLTGAGPSTPLVVGEWTYQGMDGPLMRSYPTVNQIMATFHGLPDQIPYTAWVSAAGLSNDVFNGIYHFSALSQRQLGRRYADKLYEAQQNLPQPQTSMVYWNGVWADNGRGTGTGPEPYNAAGSVLGQVTVAVDPSRGNVAQIHSGQGAIVYLAPSKTFNQSYTKLAWFQPGSPGYYNNLVSANNPNQAHFLAAVTGPGTVMIAGGHSDGSQVYVQLEQTVPAPAGVWMLITLVYDATQQSMTAYVNGQAVAQVNGIPPAPSLWSDNPVNLVMGNYGVSTLALSGVDGAMAGNRAWNVALSAQQVLAIYDQERRFRAGW